MIDGAVTTRTTLIKNSASASRTLRILPMFGFPTGARVLYGERVKSKKDLDSSVVTDRDLELAVSYFSPGAEVLRDKKTHVSVGFAAWTFNGNRARPVDSLGAR